MKKLFYIGAFAVLLTPTSSFAQDLVVLESGENSIVTGTVKEIDGRSIILIVDGKDIRVDTRELKDLQDSMEDYIPVGSYVRVIGKFDNGELEAETIVKEQAPAITTNAVGAE